MFPQAILADLRIADIECYKMQRMQNVSAVSVNHDLRIIKAFINRMMAEGRIRKNPIKDIAGNNLLKMLPKTDRPVRFLTKEEIIRLLNSEVRPRWRAILGLALNTGMRKGEIQHLTWDRVDFKNRIITVTAEGEHAPKTRRNRHIPMNGTTEAILRGLPHKVGYVFGVDAGARPFVNNFDVQFRRIIKRAGIQCRFHDLRHTFASHLAMAGTPLPAIQALLGHTDIRTTQIYLHLTPSHLTDAVGKLDFGSGEPAALSASPKYLNDRKCSSRPPGMKRRPKCRTAPGIASSTIESSHP